MNKFIVAIISLFFFAACHSTSSKNVQVEPTVSVSQLSESKEVPSKKKAIRKPEIAGTAGSLLKEYQENQLAADKKLKGKRIAVRGKVLNVTNGMFGGVDVAINDGLPYEVFSVTCNFDRDTPKLDELVKGQEIFLLGEIEQGTTVGVTLVDCDLLLVKSKR